MPFWTGDSYFLVEWSFPIAVENIERPTYPYYSGQTYETHATNEH